MTIDERLEVLLSHNEVLAYTDPRRAMLRDAAPALAQALLRAREALAHWKLYADKRETSMGERAAIIAALADSELEEAMKP